VTEGQSKGANKHYVLRVSQGDPLVVKVYGRGTGGRRLEDSITSITIANSNVNVYIYDLAYENGHGKMHLGFLGNLVVNIQYQVYGQ